MPRSYSSDSSRSKGKGRARRRSRSRSSERRGGRSRRRSLSDDRRLRLMSDVSLEEVQREESKPYGDKVDRINISENDYAFIFGRGGKTRDKLQKVSGACMELISKDLSIEISGNELQRTRGRKYVEIVMMQRRGTPTLSDVYRIEADDGDLTVLDLPTSCVGFVTGSGGNFLRQIEEDFRVLMFFAEETKGLAPLCLFGDFAGREGAKTKVMAAVETKIPGYFTKGLEERHPKYSGKGKDWDTTLIHLTGSEISWALGRRGSTRIKLARASECIVQYVGNWVHIVGTEEQRNRARDYLDWTMQQRGAAQPKVDEDRDDCFKMEIPEECVGYVTGRNRETLTRIEEEWGVVMLFLKGGRRGEKLLIFGPLRAREGARLKVMSAVESKIPGFFTKGVKDYKDPNQWGTDTFHLKDNDISFALGQGGSTRQKLQEASGCIIQIVGSTVYFVGEMEDRKRGRKYMRMLLAQRSGKVTVRPDVDIYEYKVNKDLIQTLMAGHGEVIREIEQDTKTYLFIAYNTAGIEQLFICGKEYLGRVNAIRLVDGYAKDEGRRGGGYRDDRGRGRYDDRSRGYDDRSRGSGRGRYDDRRRRRSSDSYDRPRRRRSRSSDSYRRRR